MFGARPCTRPRSGAVNASAGRERAANLSVLPFEGAWSDLGGWDAVWRVKTRRVADGWTAEIAIPFTAIRFATTGPQRWGINFIFIPLAYGTGDTLPDDPTHSPLFRYFVYGKDLILALVVAWSAAARWWGRRAAPPGAVSRLPAQPPPPWEPRENVVQEGAPAGERWNWTVATPEPLSAELLLSAIVPRTSAPAAGTVTVPVGRVLSTRIGIAAAVGVLPALPIGVTRRTYCPSGGGRGG